VGWTHPNPSLRRKARRKEGLFLVLVKIYEKSHPFLVPMQFNRDREGAGGWVRKKRGWGKGQNKYPKDALG